MVGVRQIKEAVKKNGWEYVQSYKGYIVSKREHDYCYHKFDGSGGLVSGHYDFETIEKLKDNIDIQNFISKLKYGVMFAVDGSTFTEAWTLQNERKTFVYGGVEMDKALAEKLGRSYDFMIAYIDQFLEIKITGFDFSSIKRVQENGNTFLVEFYENELNLKVLTIRSFN